MTLTPQKATIERVKQAAKSRSKLWSGLDVYFLGFDSLSRMTFQRKLPKTYRYLTQNMEAVVLEGMYTSL